VVARLIEGFEHSTVPADYATRWTVVNISGVGTSTGRYGNGANFSSADHLSKTLDAQATWVVGAAFRISALHATNTSPIFSVLDTATVQALLAITPAGTLVVCRNVVGTVLGTSAAALSPGVWYYVEWRVTIGNTGSSVVRLNEVEVLNLPSVDTMQTTTASANVVRLGASASGVGSSYDDVYVFDATGSTNTAFVGDCRVERLAPTGAGATTAWTPSAGSNYACVDEAPPNSDTDYVSSATAGQTDTYAFGNLTTASGTVFAVQATAYARKDDAGTRSLALVARPGSTDRVGATQGVTDAYTSLAELWNANPDTSAPWTIAEVNASEFGQRLIS
jgi:hypothetical protein